MAAILLRYVFGYQTTLRIGSIDLNCMILVCIIVIERSNFKLNSHK